MAMVAAPLVVRLVPTSLPIAEVPPSTCGCSAGTLVLTIATGLAFGLLPALRVCRKADGSALKDGARGGTSRGTERLRSALVVAEIVASVVLIVAVGLLTQALLQSAGFDPGSAASNVLTLRTHVAAAEVPAGRHARAVLSHVLEDMQALPGVESAAYISFLPMTIRGGVWEVLSTAPDPTSPGGFVAPTRSGPRQLALRDAGFLRRRSAPDPAGPRHRRHAIRSTRRRSRWSANRSPGSIIPIRIRSAERSRSLHGPHHRRRRRRHPGPRPRTRQQRAPGVPVGLQQRDGGRSSMRRRN